MQNFFSKKVYKRHATFFISAASSILSCYNAWIHLVKNEVRSLTREVHLKNWKTVGYLDKICPYNVKGFNYLRQLYIMSNFQNKTSPHHQTAPGFRPTC